jgi:hypothetical protein
MGFSEQKHVSMIINGTKRQTTRKPRKNHVKVGDTLFCYFKPRMKNGTCINCIKDCNTYIASEYAGSGHCPEWNNYFGTAKVTKIASFHELTNFDSTDLSKYAEVLYQWAIADGFQDFQEADGWFTKVHGPNWQNQEWDIIYFEGDWIKGGK